MISLNILDKDQPYLILCRPQRLYRLSARQNWTSDNVSWLGVKRNGHFELKTPHLKPVWCKSSCKESGYATNHQCSFMGHWLHHKDHPQKLLFTPILRLGAGSEKKKKKKEKGKRESTCIFIGSVSFSDSLGYRQCLHNKQLSSKQGLTKTCVDTIHGSMTCDARARQRLTS